MLWTSGVQSVWCPNGLQCHRCQCLRMDASVVYSRIPLCTLHHLLSQQWDMEHSADRGHCQRIWALQRTYGMPLDMSSSLHQLSAQGSMPPLGRNFLRRLVMLTCRRALLLLSQMWQWMMEPAVMRTGSLAGTKVVGRLCRGTMPIGNAHPHTEPPETHGNPGSGGRKIDNSSTGTRGLTK